MIATCTNIDNYVFLYIFGVSQSTRVDFIKLMLDANELGLKATSDAELEMKADDEEENGEVTTSTDKNDKQDSTRILKQMTMKVLDPY